MKKYFVLLILTIFAFSCVKEPTNLDDDDVGKDEAEITLKDRIGYYQSQGFGPSEEITIAANTISVKAYYLNADIFFIVPLTAADIAKTDKTLSFNDVEGVFDGNFDVFSVTFKFDDKGDILLDGITPVDDVVEIDCIIVSSGFSHSFEADNYFN